MQSKNRMENRMEKESIYLYKQSHESQAPKPAKKTRPLPKLTAEMSCVIATSKRRG
jgi:hypothetical protein